MTTIDIESLEEFEKLCQKIIKSTMVRLKVEDEHKVVELLKASFIFGMALAIDGKVTIKL